MSDKKGFLHTYRLFPLILGSLFLFAMISGLSILVWSFIVFINKADVGTMQTLPVLVWLAALFLSVSIMTYLTRGGTVFPALFLTVIAVSLSFYLAGDGLLTVGGALIKIFFSLLASVLGFTLTKIYTILVGSRKKTPKSKDEDNLNSTLIFENMDLSNDHFFIENKK